MIRVTILALLLGGCVTPIEASSTCNADTVQGWLGQKYSDRLAKTVQRKAGARAVRVIRPGMAVTMDYRVDRLNVTLDNNDVVTALRCG